MKKLIITILILSTIWSAVYAGTEYSSSTSTTGDNTLLDSVYSLTGDVDYGFANKVNNKFSMDASGRLYILYQGHASGYKWRFVSTSDWGTTWLTYNDIFVSFITTASDYTTIRTFGDSAFGYFGNTTSTPSKIRKFKNGDTTNLSLDTVSSNSSSGGARGIVMPLPSGNLLVLHTTEDGTVDSGYTYQTDGAFSQSMSYTQRAVYNKKAGMRIPFGWGTGTKGGILIYDIPNEDVYWSDTIGHDTLSTAIVPNDMPAYSSYGGFYTNMINVNDSFGVVIWQTANTAGATIQSRPFHVSNVGAGSGTIVYDSTAATILAGAYIPAGFLTCPSLSVVQGTDSVYAFYRCWTDSTDKDSIDIAYKLSPDKGRTWGSQQILRPATAGKKLWNLGTPPSFAKVNDTIRVAVIYSDSLTARDNLMVYLDKIATSPAVITKNKTLLKK